MGRGLAAPLEPHPTLSLRPLVWLLVFNSTFSTNRLYRATGVGNISHRARGQHSHIIKQWNNTINQAYINTFRPGLSGDDPLAMVINWLGFLIIAIFCLMHYSFLSVMEINVWHSTEQPILTHLLTSDIHDWKHAYVPTADILSTWPKLN